MTRLCAWAGCAAAAILAPGQCLAACTPFAVAPAAGLIAKEFQWGNDSGPLVQSFVNVSYQGEQIPALQGIDLSKNQEKRFTDYDELERCGVQFAVVEYKPYTSKITHVYGDPSYAMHAGELARRGVVVSTYFWLEPPNRDLSHYATLTDAQLAAARTLGADTARQSMAQFEREEGHRLSPASIGGLTGTLITVDAEAMPKDPTGKAKDPIKQNYGRYYGALLAGWVAGAKSVYPDAQIMLYTGPAVYVEYIGRAKKEDYAALYGLPVWLARPQPRAGDVEITNAEVDATRNAHGKPLMGAVYTQRICLSNNYNKCIVQQYSNRALFGMRSPASLSIETCLAGQFQGKCHPNHIDIDRLYPVVFRKSHASLLATRAYDPRLPSSATGRITRDTFSFPLFGRGAEAISPAQVSQLDTIAAAAASPAVQAVIVTVFAAQNDPAKALAGRRLTAVTQHLVLAGVPAGKIAASVAPSFRRSLEDIDPTVAVDIVRETKNSPFPDPGVRRNRSRP